MSETSRVPPERAEEGGFAAALTRGLAGALAQGDLFSVEVEGLRYAPAELLNLDAPVVAAICRALGAMTGTEKLILWKRHLKAEGAHGLERALQLARAHAREMANNEGSPMASPEDAPENGTGPDE